MVIVQQRRNSAALIVIVLLALICEGCQSATSEAQTCRGGGTTSSQDDVLNRRAIADHVTRSLRLSDEDMPEPLSHPFDLNSASQDFSPEKGMTAWRFLAGLASSPTFRQEYWHKQPLLIRSSDTGGWVEGAFTVDRDLRLIDDSYITGHCTADKLRNGTTTDTWEFRPLKENPARKTTWKEVEQALQGGTIYFNSAGSLWPTLGGLCRMTTAAFGLPSNVNVYVTPPKMQLSVPPHTDRQDVFVFQTQGAKRWRVFAPPPRVKGVDPLHRGKSGDVLTVDELGTPLIDTVVQKGDVLYVPTGFPHTTDTITGDSSLFDETSVHLTMGLDTHVWGLTFAHMRWSLLQRVGKDYRLDIESDENYWNAMKTIPIGFLGGDDWKQYLQNLQSGKELDDSFRSQVVKQLTDVLQTLEPNRWKQEALPSDDEMREVVEYMVGVHLRELVLIQESMFSNINMHNEESLIKAFQGTQQQNAVMERFGAFSKNEAMRSSFAQRRQERDEKLKKQL